MGDRFNRGLRCYLAAPRDRWRSSPWHELGRVQGTGSYWTEPVSVLLSELLKNLSVPIMNSEERLASVHSALREGIPLPPVEIGVFLDGSGWIIDGNHRLMAAQELDAKEVQAIFTFEGA